MSIRVMNHVWSDSPAKGSELLILLAIADFANDEGVAWPGVETLAKKARLSKRQTQYNIRSLVEAGLLKVEENSGPHGTHRYRINLASMGDAKPAPVQNVHRAKSDKGGAKSAPQGVQPIAPEPSIEPSKNRHRGKAPNALQQITDREPDDDQKLIAVWSEMCNGGKHPIKYDVARRKARVLVKAGFDEDETRELIQWLRKQTWITGGITLNLMESQADSFRASQTGDSKVRRFVV